MEMGTGSVKTNSKQNYEIEILEHDEDVDHINSKLYVFFERNLKLAAIYIVKYNIKTIACYNFLFNNSIPNS